MVTFLVEGEFISKRARNPRKGSGHARMDNKPFVAWDGEGWTKHVCKDPDNCVNRDGACKHHYYLFGASTGEYISGSSLGTTDCFDLMLECETHNPDAIHVSFSFKYDLDMMFRDMAPAHVKYLMKHNRLKWNGYYLEVLPGKWIQVTQDGVTCRIYDLFSFFAMSFVKALEKWNVGTSEQRARILAGKEQRGTFTLDNLETDVIPYWRGELDLLVQLATTLRDVLYSAGIKPARWHGPGAVADYLFRENKTKLAKPEFTPEPVLDAGQYAYAGGRFEAFRIGLYEGPIYSADINSAYPYAMSLLPNMATGAWIHTVGMPEMDSIRNTRLGLYHVRYVYGPEANRAIVYGGMPGAAHYRYPKSGTIHFRNRNPGVWVHHPEFVVLLEQYRLGLFEAFEVTEAWEFVDDGTYPFAWVREIYAQRKAWKDSGNPAQLAAKLGINSLYGKLAQRLGGSKGVPTWHNLEWAGHITSTCRAMLYQGSWKQYANLVAYETDGIYSTAPMDSLPNGTGDGLGEWETKEYSGILYLQSGVYWLRDKDGNWLPPKSRGIPQQHLDFGNAYSALVNKEPLRAEQTQFIRFGLASMRRDGLRIWRTWQKNEKEFAFGGNGLGGNGKRIHIEKSCKECAQGYGRHETLHTLMLSPKGFKKENGIPRESAPHYLPWRTIGEEPENVAKSAILNRWGETDT